MPTSDDPKTELLAFTHQMLDDWVRRGDGALERFLEHFDADVIVIGTGEDEMAVGKEELARMVRREMENVPHGFSWQMFDERVVLLSDTAGFVSGGLVLRVPIDGHEVFSLEVRFSLICRRTGAGWRGVHWHASRPDTEQPEGESLPIDALRARNEELERVVAERTAEIEAARREAQVEAALERVRSRTMAMHRSDELAETAAVLFQQLEALEMLPPNARTYIAMCDTVTETAEVWMTQPDGTIRPGSHRTPLTEHPSMIPFYQSWLRREPLFVRDYFGAALTDYLDFVLSLPHTQEDAGYQRLATSPPERIVMTDATFSDGTVGVMSAEPLAPEAQEVLQRFARVFEQTYTRFLDLKRAEAQAREARVEAALERVRARAMAMHQSEDLAHSVEAVFMELERLGLTTLRCGIGLVDGATRKVVVWTTVSTHHGDVVQVAGDEQLEGHPLSDAIFDAWSRQEDLSYTLEGDDLASYYREMNAANLHLPVGRTTSVVPPDARQFYHCTMFPAGGLYAFRNALFPPEAKRVMRRFADVFHLAYTRFEDIQEAEARAKEATRQAALDRVRAEIASMRTAADLQRITPLVWRELTTLGVPFFRCGIFIIDESTETTQLFLTTPEGKALAALALGFDDAPLVTATVEHWRQDAVYKETWDAARMHAWTTFLQERGLIQTPTRYLDAEAPPEHLALHFVPFAQGMLYVGSQAALGDEALELVQALADAFAVAYARYEDFQRIEAARSAAEATLADLQAAQQQLVHAEKMASLGALTAGIAHEIKNPLNFVNNFASLSRDLVDDLLAETDPDEVHALLADLKANAEKIEQHGKRADGIVRAMMQHARGGEGERHTVKLNPFVDEYVDLAYHGKRAQTPDFNVVIDKDLDERVGEVELVPQEIGRVLLNLLGNAFDAVYEHASRLNGQYTPTVRVATRRAGAHLEIRVEDNGPGISDAVRARIFEPFFTTKPTGQGTGLGLSLSYDIVTQGHGGSLAVESEKGETTTFIVRLPVSATD